MFTVSTDVGVLRVEFEHKRFDWPVPEDMSEQRFLNRQKGMYGHGGRTTCMIVQLVPDHPENEVTVATGTATCHWNDQWDYGKGRKLALGRAVVRAVPFKRYGLATRDALELRRLIWHAYFLMSNRPELVQPDWNTRKINTVTGYVDCSETTLAVIRSMLDGGPVILPPKVNNRYYQTIG